MALAKSSFLRQTAILVVIALLALIAIVGTTIWLVARTQTSFDAIIQARDARTASVDLRKSVQDMESSQRGYLLTGDKRYLEPYGAARDRVADQYATLKRTLAPFAFEAAAVDALGQTLNRKIAELEQTIALYRAGDTARALEIVKTDRGENIMEDARVLFDQVVDAADKRLAASVAAQRANTNALWWVAIFGGIVILAVVSGLVWLTLAYTRELIEARANVENFNLELEERVKERTEDLIRANEEIQRFAYIVTHDLRAPLVNIMGFTSELDETMETIRAYVMADGEPLGELEIKDARQAAAEDLPEAIGFIRSSTKKMDGLINAILKISREGRRPLKPESLDLKSVLETTAASVHHQIADTEGAVEIDADIPDIVSDRLSLEQIFGNLVDNAIKYRAADRPIRIAITARRELGGRVAIEVSDNGRGIAEADHERVFDLFRRSGTQDKPGEGIGLAHVRTLARSLGGDVRVRSTLGEGTTFTVYLPKDVRVFMRRNAS